MTISPVVIFHIACAVIALLSGFMAMVFRKGSGLHGAAGTAYFVSMVGMTTSGAYGAVFIKPNRTNVIVALLALYLVLTAWVAAKRREKRTNAFDVVACVFAFAVSLTGVMWGVQAETARTAYTFLATIGLMFAVSDVRMLRRGGVEGVQRIKRHLWRMSLTLLLTLLSFYPGQSRNLPAALRASALAYAPHIFVAAMVVFWMLRLRKRDRKTTANRPAEPPAPLIFPASPSVPLRSSTSRADKAVAAS